MMAEHIAVADGSTLQEDMILEQEVLLVLQSGELRFLQLLVD